MPIENRILGEQSEEEKDQERRDRINDQLCLISLRYAEIKYLTAKEKNPDVLFSQFLMENTPIERIILGALNNRQSGSQEAINIEQQFYRDADALCQNGKPDIERIFELIKALSRYAANYAKNLPEEPAPWIEIEDADETTASAETKNPDFKFIKINIIADIKKYSRAHYSETDMENYGFSPLDSFIDMHLDTKYGTVAPQGYADLKKDFSALAEYIVDQKPEIRAVIGSSWLIDAFGEKMGFTRKDERLNENDFSTWFQFLNQGGQIDMRRVQKMLETGELPYRNTAGFISTEDFLKRYLPEDRRGELTLKKINPEMSTIWPQAEQTREKIRSNWNRIIEQGLDFDGFIEETPELIAFLDLLPAGKKILYLDFLRKMSEEKIAWKEISSRKPKEIKAIESELEQIKNDRIYKEVKVEIPPKDIKIPE